MSVSFRNNVPYSEIFDDIYFNPAQGLAETEYVFLKANHLKEKLSTLSSLSIGELGFGTGLNFLATLNLWQSLPGPKAELHYFSIEKFPLTQDLLQKAHALFPELAPAAQLLQQHYPLLLNGFHAITLIPNAVYLYLLIGDVNDMLPQIEGPIDVWFLDGFAPAKNKEMWHEALFHAIAERSHTHTCLSTFSAAGAVKRALSAASFKISKIKGFGMKREMLTAQYTRPFKSPIPPWFSRPPVTTICKKVAIIGAGLSGLLNAYHLQEAGFSVEVFDQSESLPNAQSRNPAMLLKPYLSPNLNFFDQYYTQGFLGVKHLIKTIAPQAVISKGLLDIAVSSKKQEKLAKIFEKRSIPADFATLLNADAASALAGMEITYPALYYPEAQIIEPACLVECLLAKFADSVIIHLGYKADPVHLRKKFDAVILASGANACLDFSAFALSLSPGQVSICKQNSVLQKFKIALAYEGYCIPDASGNWILGSSFRKDASLEILAKDHLQNLNYLNKAIPSMADSIKPTALQGFTGMRLAARDHLPLIGGLPILEQWANDFDRLRFGDHRYNYPEASYEPGIYFTLAHGSKGLSSSFMASKIITALLTQRPLPVGLSLWNALQPARFWLRTLKCANSVF